jgi:hypothetical protein
VSSAVSKNMDKITNVIGFDRSLINLPPQGILNIKKAFGCMNGYYHTPVSCEL